MAPVRWELMWYCDKCGAMATQDIDLHLEKGCGHIVCSQHSRNGMCRVCEDKRKKQRKAASVNS